MSETPLIRGTRGSHESRAALKGHWVRWGTGAGYKGPVSHPGGFTCHPVRAGGSPAVVCAHVTTLGLEGLFSKMRTWFLSLFPLLPPTQCHGLYKFMNLRIWEIKWLKGSDFMQDPRSVRWRFVMGLSVRQRNVSVKSSRHVWRIAVFQALFLHLLSCGPEY